MRDEQPQYRDRGIQTIGVNPAPVASHERYAEKLRLTFPLASDPGAAVAAAYGAVKSPVPLLSAIGERVSMGLGSIVRTVYLIGRDGTIRFARRGMPSVEDMLAALETR